MRNSDIGAAVKARRSEKNFTLADLASASGVSASMLSEIECGKKNPTIRTAFQIASGLGCTISELLNLPQTESVDPAPARCRQILVDPETGVERHLLSPALVQRGIQVLLYRAPSGTTIGAFPPDRPSTLAHLTALRGALVVTLGAREYALNEGDSMAVRGDQELSMRNDGDDWSELLIVVDQTQVAGGR